MKNIKEQAEELEIEVFRTTRSKDVAERCKWSYIKGAKYVLECIEEATNICFDEELKHVIEQLKK